MLLLLKLKDAMFAFIEMIKSARESRKNDQEKFK